MPKLSAISDMCTSVNRGVDGLIQLTSKSRSVYIRSGALVSLLIERSAMMVDNRQHTVVTVM